MKKKVSAQKPKAETTTDLKKEAVKKDAVKKGYNEHNPAQEQGAFKPDNTAADN